MGRERERGGVLKILLSAANTGNDAWHVMDSGDANEPSPIYFWVQPLKMTSEIAFRNNRNNSRDVRKTASKSLLRHV